MKTDQSIELFAASRRLLPGGVSSPVRAFNAVGGQPLFIARGEGAYLFDVDGNSYIDYVLSWGPLILGHAHPRVTAAVEAAARRGTSYGAPSPPEIDLARQIVDLMPSLEMIRFVNSGTEATMSAIRLARAFTRRDKIIKFEGAYHGHADCLLVRAGSGVATLGLPDSPGVTRGAAADTLVARYNDIDSVGVHLRNHDGEIAAVIVEPVAGNMGLVSPETNFLPGLREMTAKANVLLIFDEVMTGFRVHRGGAQALYGVTPDLTTLGKVIGGGLPVGAFGGRRDIMEMVAPLGPVYQAGTLSGNPLVMAAGAATLDVLRDDATWDRVERLTRRLVAGMAAAAQAEGVSLQCASVGTMFGFFLSGSPVRDWESARQSDVARFARLHRAMLERGVYLAPSQFEAGFISTAHNDADIDRTVEAIRESFRLSV